MGLAVRSTLEEAEKTKKKLVELGVLDGSRKIQKDDQYILFPVTQEVAEFLVVDVVLDERKRVPTLREALANDLTVEEQELLKTAYDIVGEIAIIEIDKELRGKEKLIAEKLLETNPVVTTVVRKDGGHEGELRIQQYKYLAGVDTKQAIVCENGVRLTFAIDKAYYSIRSSTERARIAGLVEEQERVLVMFSGIGPFVCVLGKLAPVAEVVGVELNADGHRFAEANIEQNKLSHARVFQGDVRDVVPTLGVFDRILMPLPHTAQDFLDVAVPALASGGVIHLYHFDSEEAVQEFAKTIPSRLQEIGRAGEVKHIQKCGNLGPGIHRWCLDIVVA